MRVLWFTNGPLPAATRRAGVTGIGSGHWMSSLLEHARRVPGLQIAVAAAAPGMGDDRFLEDGVEYFVIGQPRFQSIFSCRPRDLERAAEVVRQTGPDLVHIHGSERFYGLLPARRMISQPAVISLQGFLAPCLGAFFGALSPGEVWRSQRLIELATRRGLFWRYRELKAGTRQEREILAGCGHFMGRTEWDRAVLASHNPSAAYYHVGEILRAPFGEARWDLERCDRYSILFTNAGEPRRGTDVLLRALTIVRRTFPQAKLRLSGGLGHRRGYDRFLRRTISSNGLAGSVEYLGYLDGNAMAAALRQAHVFVQPSLIENSSNSLCEAMQVGLPCVAAYTGGIPSLVEHRRSALLTPAGDAALLASAILEIFRDDETAVRLGRAARACASERHAPDTVISQLLEAYHDVVATHQTCTSARMACPA